MVDLSQDAVEGNLNACNMRHGRMGRGKVMGDMMNKVMMTVL